MRSLQRYFSESLVMTIPKRKPSRSAEEFIAGAPDARVPSGREQSATRRVTRTIGNKLIITVSIGPDALDAVDEWARKRSMSRAAAIAYAISLLPE